MKDSSRRIGFARAAALTAVAGLSVLVACEARLPTSAELDNMDVASMQKSALNAKLVARKAGDSVAYYVNDVRVSEAEANRLSAKEIATVNIAKGEKGHLSVVRVVTDSAAHSFKAKRMMLRKDGTAGEAVEAKPGIMLRKTQGGPAPLFYINGVLSTEGALSRLSGDAIESIEVLKGDAAARMVGDSLGVNGVIKVTTKGP